MRSILLVLLACFSLALFSQEEKLDQADSLAQKGQYLKAYNIQKELLAALYLEEDWTQYTEVHLLMIDNLLQGGDPFRAKNLAENTLSFIEKELKSENELLARCHTLLGLSFINLGKSDEALEQLLVAESLFKNSNKWQANCFDALGLVYTNNENKTLASQYHEQALRIRRGLFGARSIPVANSYNNLGRVFATDDPLQAIIYFNRAKGIYEKELGENSRRALRSKLNIAFANTEQKNYAEALTLLKEVKASYENQFGADNSNVAFTLSSIGRVQLLEKAFENALISQKEALQIYIKLYGEKHPEVANTYYLIGEVHKARSEFKLASDFYQRSIYVNLPGQSFSSLYELPQLTNYQNADILLTSLQAKAISLEALHYQKTLNLKDLTGAIDTYTLCDELITAIRRIRLNENDKLRLGRIASEVYESGIQLALNLSEQSFNRKKYVAKAFEFCERSKSSILLEAITESNAKNFSGIPEDLLSLEDSLKDEISFLEQQLASDADEDPQQREDLLFTYQNSYREFVSRLETNYPEYYNLKYSHQLADKEAIQGKLKSNEAMLSFFIGTEEIYTFILIENKIDYRRVPIPEKFERAISAFSNAIKYDLKGSFFKASKELYEALIPKLPPSINSLIVLPDGKLGSLPFEALLHPDSKGNEYTMARFLISDYNISYDYSATLFVNREHKQHVENPKILLVAPVEFSKNELVMTSLPGSEVEIDEIELLFKGSDCIPTVKLRNEANEGSFKTESLESYEFVHFATHGIVNQEKPELSRIFLNPGDDEDGSLYTGEIYNLSIQADLVTLSACETGLGKVAKGEGIVGLSRALQYAGANNIIVSLWQVSDASTAEMMIEFYKYNLSNRKYGYNAALRKAKMSLLTSESYSNPYYWAPFILIGQ